MQSWHGHALRAETASNANALSDGVPSPPHCVGPQVGALWRPVKGSRWCAKAACLSGTGARQAFAVGQAAAHEAPWLAA